MVGEDPQLSISQSNKELRKILTSASHQHKKKEFDIIQKRGFDLVNLENVMLNLF
jgi:hypothetical protein